jgi:predicted amidophosphoribosyltransferase
MTDAADGAIVRAEYREALQRKDRYFNRTLLVGVAFILIVAGNLISGRRQPDPVSGFMALILWVVGAVRLVFHPRVRCPRCQGKVDSKVDHLCPECGAEGIDKGTWFRSPRCSACKMVFETRKGGRLWQVRYCSFCGVLLDETVAPPKSAG